jgi:hypothetical protein
MGVVDIRNKRYTWLPLCYKNCGSAQNVSPIVTVKLFVNLLRIQEIQVSNLPTDTANHETFHGFISPLRKFWGSS